MFLDALRRRNPRLIEQAIALHQAGRIPANTYVIDLDAAEANARAMRRGGGAAWAQGFRHDQADGAQRRLLRGGGAAAASAPRSASTWNAPARRRRAGMAIGHIGHLVQIPRAEADAAASLRTRTTGRCSTSRRPTEAAAAAKKRGTQPGIAGADPGRGRPLLSRPRGRLRGRRRRRGRRPSRRAGRRALRRHHHLPGSPLRSGGAEDRADAEPYDAPQRRGRCCRAAAGGEHRDQRAGHHIVRGARGRSPTPARRRSSRATA